MLQGALATLRGRLQAMAPHRQGNVCMPVLPKDTALCHEGLDPPTSGS